MHDGRAVLFLVAELIVIYPRTKLYFKVIEIPFVMITGKSLKETVLS